MLKKMLIYGFGFVLSLAVLGAIYFRTADPDPGVVDFATLEKKPSPNQFLVAPAGFTREPPDLEAPTFPQAPEALRELWRERIGGEATLLNSDDELLQEDWRQRTPLMGYPDTITVRFLSHEDGSTLAIYSRSHFGHSDLGANEKRVRAWLGMLQ